MFNLDIFYFLFFIKHLKKYSLWNVVETTILGKIFFLLGAFSLKKLFKDLFLSYILFMEEIFFKKSIKPKSLWLKGKI
jgi:hypothetical protein